MTIVENKTMTIKYWLKGTGSDGNPVFLKDLWPSHDEIAAFEEQYVRPQFFADVYANITAGNSEWQQLQISKESLYPWEASSTYLKRVPFFDNMVSWFNLLTESDRTIW